MNSWYTLRRMRGAIYLIVIGILALLNQYRILTWDQSWPFFLIVPGVLMLAERAAWTADLRRQQEEQGTPMPQQNFSWPSDAGGPHGRAAFIQTTPPPPEDSGREEQ
jgi:hypothetical protein